MKKIFLLFMLIAAICGASWAGYTYLNNSAKEETKAKESFAQIEIGSVESVVTAQGTLEPKDYVNVGAQVSGMIETLHVDIGDTVEKGQLIAEIDPDVYESQVRGDEAKLKTLRAQKAEQEALVNQAKTKLNRNKKLLKERAVSTETVEDAQTDLDVSKAKLLSLDAQIEQAESTLEGDKTNLNYTKIYAPMNGSVVDKSVSEGETINASQSAPEIVQIADLDIMTVRAQVAEADVMKLSIGMPVYFTTLGSQNRKWEATVRQILPTPEEINDVILYNVLVDVQNKDHQLMTGMTTQMFFVLASAKDQPVIPKTALIKELPEQNTSKGEAYEVHVLGANRSVEKRTVIIGASDRTKAAIVSGLEVGEVIALDASIKTTDVSESKNKQRTPRKIPGMGRL
jgi:macrolide-specific efflux system membrane fusion protein